MRLNRLFAYALILMCVCLFGCGRQQDAAIDTALPETVKTDAILLKMVPMDIKDEFIYADIMTIYQDSILIIRNKANTKAIPSVQLYNINRGEIIGGFAHYGNGPREVLGIYTYLNRNNLQIKDYSKNQFAFIDLDKHPATPRDIEVNKIFNSINIGNYARYNDDSIVVVNPHFFEDKKLGIKNTQSQLLYIVSPRQLTEQGINFDNYEINTRNVTQVSILTNSNKKRIVTASFHSDIKVYDEDFNIIKTVTGPDEFDVNYATRDLGGPPHVAFGKDSPNTYQRNFYAADDYFLVLYIGSPDFRAVPQYLFKFDWDGNFLESYRVDSRLATISVGSDGETMYAMTYDDEGLPMMVKLVQ